MKCECSNECSNGDSPMGRRLDTSMIVEQRQRSEDYLFNEGPPLMRQTNRDESYLRRAGGSEVSANEGSENCSVVLRPNQKVHLLFLLAAISTICCSSQCLLLLDGVAAQQQETLATKLPTVIVRGFLNYRTTVDGTVLLFTPDAGGQQSAIVPSSSTEAFSARSSDLDNLRPDRVQQDPTQTLDPTTTREPNQVRAANAAADEQPNETDQWRPIQATPPLRSVQTTFQPGGHFQDAESSSVVISSASRDGADGLSNGGRQLASDRPVQMIGIGGFVASAGQIGRPVLERVPGPASQIARPVLDRVPESAGQIADPVLRRVPVAVGVRPAPVGNRRPVSGLQPRLSSEFTGMSVIGPSVQTDELTAEDQPQQDQPRPPPTRAVMKARRPSLGFHGQGARTDSRPSNQADQANSDGRINGIRRPGLPTTTTTTTTTSPLDNSERDASQSSSGAAQPVVSAFQARLQSAKLRNKFRRPGSSALGTPAANGSTLAGAESPSVSAEAIETDKENLQQVGSSTSSNMLGNQLPVVAELQFRPGSYTPSLIVGGGNDDIFPAGLSQARGQFASGPEPEPASEAAAGQGAAGPGSFLESRLGEQRPRPEPEHAAAKPSTGTLETPGVPLSFDSFFQNDHPHGKLAASEHKPSHLAPRKKANNDKINGRLDQHHHNKLNPRPPAPTANSPQVNLAPSFSSNIPSVATPQSSQLAPTQTATVNVMAGELSSVTKPTVGSVLDEPTGEIGAANSSSHLITAEPAAAAEQLNGSLTLQLQTITKTYSTVMTSLKTRLVPLQVKSSTGVHTLIESYVITKLMTAYQTMPVGEFILPEPLSTRAPFEMFNEPTGDPQQQLADQAKSNKEQVAANFVAPSVSEPQQEQPIMLNESPKSANDWLHDFASQNPFNPAAPDQQHQHQHQQLAAILDQQAQEANLAAGLSGEPLDQLASSLDPAALLAGGSINIPDLNNPLVLAAAIQNPQLAAVILAAQQLRLRQQQQQQRAKQPGGQLVAPASYSTTLSTTIRPSTYTVRDTMYTTRLVSFKDGRTVRTRTVSEPGSVIEQVLTTMATEVTPITVTIRPTGVMAAPSMQATAAATNNQATINNALFATQLASLLARRQQQVQPSTAGVAPSQDQLALLQQLISGQQQQLGGSATRPQQQQQQFQPNLQQLLQSMQQQPPANSNTKPVNEGSVGNNKPPSSQTSAGGQLAGAQDTPANKAEPPAGTVATPPLPALPSKPFVTTLTNLQVRTYTVHNAFKTIYRTITSTQLVTSTILSG